MLTHSAETISCAIQYADGKRKDIEEAEEKAAHREAMEEGARAARKYRMGNVLHLPGLAYGGHIISNGKQVRTHN